MRKIIYIVLLGIMAMVSCTKEEGGNKAGEVKFTGGLLQTRVGGADGATWEAGDRVGVYMFADPGTFTTTDILAENKEYIASAGTSAAFFEADGVPMTYPLNGSNVKFVAYHPYSSAITTSYLLPIDLSNQSNQSAIDVLYVPVTASYNKSNHSPVPLNFSHKLSKLVFIVNNGGEIDFIADNVSVKIKGQQTVGTLNLTDGTVSSSGTTSDILIQSAGTATTAIVEAIVFPGSTTSLEVVLSHTGQIFTVTVPNATWHEGNKYIYTITIKGEGVAEVSGTIVPWNSSSGNDYSGIAITAQKNYPYVIDISDANFDNCYIYEIWDEIHNIKIGELCKEYLHKFDGTTEIVRKQAVVAYPTLSNGKIDLANGLEVPTGNFIAWNPSPSAAAPSDILASYGPGETISGATPTIIYLAPSGTRMTTIDLAAPPAERVNAVLKPYLLRDQRTGPDNGQGSTSEDYSYKLVKIGTQYWTAEHLRTSRYRDGSNIPTNISNSNWSATIGPGCVGHGYGDGTDTYLNVNTMTPSQREEYGVMYNFYAVVKQTPVSTFATPLATPEDMISPNGWHIPSKEQVLLLINYSSQSTVTAASVVELITDASATISDPYFNMTGFGFQGYGYRGVSGAWNAGTIIFWSMDYQWVSDYGTLTLRHTAYTFCAYNTTAAIRPTSNSTNWLADGYLGANTGNYIRLIKDE